LHTKGCVNVKQTTVSESGNICLVSHIIYCWSGPFSCTNRLLFICWSIFTLIIFYELI